MIPEGVTVALIQGVVKDNEVQDMLCLRAHRSIVLVHRALLDTGVREHQ